MTTEFLHNLPYKMYEPPSLSFSLSTVLCINIHFGKNTPLCYLIRQNHYLNLVSELIIPRLVTDGTAKICCLGLILALFYSTVVIKNDFG